MNDILEQAKEYGEVTLRGYYEEKFEVFFLLEGSHRIEAAHLLGLPLMLVHCDLDDRVDVELPELAVEFDKETVFDRDGFAQVRDLLGCINHSGRRYDELEFESLSLQVLDGGYYYK